MLTRERDAKGQSPVSREPVQVNRRPGRLRRAPAIVTTAALLSGALVGVATPAGASTCSASAPTRTWAPAGVDSEWSNPANWNPAGVPGADDKVVVDLTSATVTGITGSVCDLVLKGGGTAATATALAGELTVAGSAEVEGFAKAPADGTFTLRVAGKVKPTAETTLDKIALVLAAGSPGAELDLGKKRLFLTGAATSRLEAGSKVIDASDGGTTATGLVVGNAATLAVTTGATVVAPAIVRLQPGSTITTGGVDAAATLGGTGVLNWQAGTLVGDLTLRLRTVMDGAGQRVVSAGSTLVNDLLPTSPTPTPNKLEVRDGVVQLEGSLVNHGELRAFPGNPGPQFTQSGSSDAVLQNKATGILAVGAVDTAAGSGQARLVNVPLDNSGKITIVGNSRLLLAGDPGAVAESDLRNGTTVKDPYTPPSGSTPTKGTLQVGSGAALRLNGTTTLQGGAIVQLDDNVDGTKARLEGVKDSSPKLVGAAAAGTDGTFQWRSGVVRGPITVDKVATDVGAVGTTSRRYLELCSGCTGTAFTSNGPFGVNATMVTLRPNAQVVAGGPLVIASTPSGFERSGTSVDGQKLTIAAGGSLTRRARAFIPGGTSENAGATTLNVPVVNHGSVTLETPLTVPAGYVQEHQPGAPASAAPITGLLGPNVTLSTSNGAGQYPPIELRSGGLGGAGTIVTSSLNVGSTWVHPGFTTSAGKITVQGTLRLSSGSDVQLVMRPAVAATATTAAVPASQDVLEVVPLVHTTGSGSSATSTAVAPGMAYLAGRITGVSASGLTQPYGDIKTSLVKFAARSGSFSSASWSGTPTGLGWKPLYDSLTTDGDGQAVDLKLVDVAPPALGIASIPAFTQFGSQRVTYAAVDNKTGVASYDVRFQRASPTRGFSSWVYTSTWQRTTRTSRTLTGLATGYTYCFSIRVRDKAGNVSAWSRSLCTARMFDDRALKASRGWTRPGGKAGFYGKTYSRSTRKGATLSKYGTHSRVAVTALKCPTCGTAYVYSGSTLLKKLDLRARRTGITTWVSKGMSRRTGYLRIKVVSRGKPVVIDSFGMVR